MKKLSSLLLILVAALCLTACSDSPDSLGASKAKKLFKKEMARTHRLEGFANVRTGYYECNDNEDRYKLRQLAANDIVTYKCDVVKKTERVRKKRRVQAGYYYRYWTTESYYVNEEVDTYFVTVELTEKGRALLYEPQEAEPDEDTKELKLDQEIDLSKYPEYKVEAEEFSKPAAQAEAPAVVETPDTVAAYEESEEAFQPDEPATEAVDSKASAYDKAKAKEKYEDVMLKAFELDVIKARNVCKTSDNTAKAQILMEYEDVTPVGRVMMGVYDGQRFVSPTLHYTYFEDKGWQLDSDE